MIRTEPPTRMRLGGHLGCLADAVTTNWLIPAPSANPGMLEMFRLRDRTPAYDNPEPWAGEFAGKHLVSAIAMLRVADNPGLRDMIGELVSELVSLQADDGYLGVFAKDDRLLGHWDLWNHHHVMAALRLWWHETGDRAALECALRAADLICRVYPGTGRRVLDAGSPEMNMAVMGELLALHRITGTPEYLRLARQIEEEWALPGAGDYLNAARAGLRFHQTPLPRWESLHCLQALAELHRVTGRADYRDALLYYWRGIRRTDVHNNGSFSTGEGAVGSPFLPGAIETCCTVAWMALSVDALELSHDAAVADALELALWNAVAAYLHPSGRWCTYDTPMDGKRQASAHGIVFQARAGTPELNCCSVNGPRGLAMLGDWAVTQTGDGIHLNYYGPCVIETVDSGGVTWRLEQTTEFPRDGLVRVAVDVTRPVEATLHLRIPGWSRSTVLAVNRSPAGACVPGTYQPVRRLWQSGDVIELRLDMSVRFEPGDGSVGHRCSVYRGPLLLAYDQKHNAIDPDRIPTLDALVADAAPVDARARFSPMVAVSMRGVDGREMVLCDFASAGAHGTHYVSWLPVANAGPGAFLLEQPSFCDRVPRGAGVRFRWGASTPGAAYHLVVASDPGMSHILQDVRATGTEVDVTPQPDWPAVVHWQVTASDARGHIAAHNGPFVLNLA